MVSPNLVLKYKKFYRSIGSVKCSYFNEDVYFNRKGFNHLIRKGRDRRLPADQERRLFLLKYCRRIIEGEYIIVSLKIVKGLRKTSRFWAFKASIDGYKMRLIVRQIDGGIKHFFGIFPIKH